MKNILLASVFLIGPLFLLGSPCFVNAQIFPETGKYSQPLPKQQNGINLIMPSDEPLPPPRRDAVIPPETSTDSRQFAASCVAFRLKFKVKSPICEK